MTRGEDRHAVAARTSFAEAVDRAVINTVIGDVAGKRLRVRRLRQTIGEDLTPVAVGTDHTLVFQMGGVPDVRRYYEGKESGRVDRLRICGILPAHIPTQWTGGEVDVLHIHLDDARFRDLVARHDMDPDRVELIDRMGVTDPFVAALAPALLHELRSDAPSSRLMVDGFDSIVAGHLMRAYSTQAEMALKREERLAEGREKAAIARVQAEMMARLDENIGLDALADLAGLPPFVLMRRFKRETGTTPHAWLIGRRVARARDLLLGTRAPIAEIALDCGFASQSHLTQTFARHVGTTPARFRRRGD